MFSRRFIVENLKSVPLPSSKSKAFGRLPRPAILHCLTSRMSFDFIKKGSCTFVQDPLSRFQISKSFGKAAQFSALTRVAEFAQGLGFDLPDPLPRHLKVLPHFLQRMIRRLPDPKPLP